MNKPDNSKPNRKSAFLGCGCLMSPFLLLLCLFLLTPLYNNFRLQRFAQRFQSISHPTQSKFVARTKEVGLFANGNHCDFLVAEVRSFAGSQNAVRNFYRSTRVAVPNNADDSYSDVKNGTQPVEIEFLRSPLPANYRWKYSFAEGVDLSAAKGQQNLYVVFIGNSGENNSWESFCDLRCT